MRGCGNLGIAFTWLRLVIQFWEGVKSVIGTFRNATKWFGSLMISGHAVISSDRRQVRTMVCVLGVEDKLQESNNSVSIRTEQEMGTPVPRSNLRSQRIKIFLNSINGWNNKVILPSPSV